MDTVLEPVGIRTIKNQFSALTEEVNASGASLTVLKNNRPWVVIHPADAQSAERRSRLAKFRALTARIEDCANEPAWDESVSDRQLLDEERVRRFG